MKSSLTSTYEASLDPLACNDCASDTIEIELKRSRMSTSLLSRHLSCRSLWHSKDFSRQGAEACQGRICSCSSKRGHRRLCSRTEEVKLQCFNSITASRALCMIYCTHI